MRASRQQMAVCGLLIIMGALGCARERRPQSVSTTSQTTATSINEPSVPVGPSPSQAELERQRFDPQWRALPSVQTQTTAPRTTNPGSSNVAIQFTTSGHDDFESADPSAWETLPVAVPIQGDVKGPTVLRAQILLDRANFSAGEIDGRWGKNSQIAAFFFQQTHGIAPTGNIDEATYSALAAASPGPSFRRQTLTENDVKGPFQKIPDNVYEQEKLPCLCYQTPVEEVAEEFHVAPEMLKTLNPNIGDDFRAGTELLVPNVRQITEGVPKDIARIVISVKGNYFHGLDSSGALRFHAPTTLGSKYEPSPNETVKLLSITPNPNFLYQPKLFVEVPDTNPEAQLKPGPNNPVGVVWMALSKPHYGIHGTPKPATIGYASSHGCVRLTNWDAHDVSHRVSPGIDVEFVDTRTAASAPNEHKD